ncbi:MAG: hypothetical protein JXB39_02680 [Deltaproteobacteria bacterium]|nr:hypothetical protein [Deltaproteobacteria bacterium]
MIRPPLPFLLLACWATAGCYLHDEDTSPPEDTAPEYVPCLPVMGVSGEATITPEGPATVAYEFQGWASIVTVDEKSPIPFASERLLARGACGTVGILARDPSDDELPLLYVDVTQPKPVPEIVAESESALEEAALFYDEDCAPVVIRLNAPDGFLEQVRDPKGTWPEPTELDVTAGIGGPPTTLGSVEAWTDADGNMHLAAVATLGANPRIVHGVRAPAAGASWTFEGFEAPPITDIATYRTDANGGLHAVYTITEYPCSPCDVGLYYGYLPLGGVWTETLVEPSVWASPGDEYAYDVSLVVTSTGLPIFAATWLERARTGALSRTQLRVYSVRESTGEWCYETVARESDTYQGGRGTAFTGVHPNLVLDATDRPHIVFSDTSLWYDDEARANAIDGQIRYAVRTGDRWTVTTLYAQQGQSESLERLHGLEAPMLAPSADGTHVVVGGVARTWETDSIYNDTPKNVTFQATVVQADVTQP